MFLIEYYFNADLSAQAFRAQNTDHAATMLSTYDAHCVRNFSDEHRAQCVAHQLRPVGEMLGFHSYIAFPSARRIRAAKPLHVPQYVDHPIERSSRNSS